MKVRVLNIFHDLKEKCLRYPGGEFEATEERVAEINSTKAGLLVEVIQEQEPVKAGVPSTEPEKEPKPKATKVK